LTGTPAVVVGVVDTGIRYTHQDLAGNMWVNPGEIPGNGIDDDSNGYVDDVHGIDAITQSGNPMDANNHGSHCAGMIAAVAGNAGQQVGVAYHARLMALRFMNAAGKGTLSNAIRCIDYGVTQGTNILSNSWSGEEFSQALVDTIEAANAAGVLFIASAGNTASDNDSAANYPSNYASGNVVAVAAIDRNGNLASFSSYGASNVDLAAPGVAILSCTAASDTSYGSLDGTSMAAPYVAGVAALLKSLYPTAGVMEIKNRLLASASPLPALSGRQEFPEIAVEQPLGTNLADADTTDFGLVAAGSKASLTFTIKNTRTANLTGVTITVNGPNAADFTVTAHPAALVGEPDGTTSFTVRFAPSAAGIRTAALHLASNDPDENPFDINLSGIGAALPEIAVEQPAGIEIPDGGRVSFGAMLVSVWGTSTSLTLTISNSGGSDLSGLEITKDGNNPSEFTVSGPATTTVAGGGSTTFTLSATPGATGPRVAALHLASDDPDENPFDIELRVGAGTDQEFWRQKHFGSPANSGDGADLNDFESDGIPNLLEFAFDLHPQQSSAGLLPQPQVIGNHLVISFIQAEKISGITYGAESSPTLLPGSWFDVTDTGVAPQQIFSVPIGTKPSLFLRLKVSSP
jgi:hypothetical protein